MSGDELILEELENQTLILKDINSNIEVSNNIFASVSGLISFLIPILVAFLIFKLFGR